jgi:hypothetical protein
MDMIVGTYFCFSLVEVIYELWPPYTSVLIRIVPAQDATDSDEF